MTIRRWHVDDGYAVIGHERPGPPEPDGPWERAGTIVRDYGFTDHRRLRGAYRASAPLLGRDMLLEGRFTIMRFHLGVRVTDIVDIERDGHRIWGWSYETLSGHLEQGRLTYEVDKDLASGEVTFWIRAFSRRAPGAEPVLPARVRLVRTRRAARLLPFGGATGPRARGDRAARAGAGQPTSSSPRGTAREHWWDRWAVHVYQPGA